MPQKDKYRDRVLPLEFVFQETMTTLPYPDRMTIVLISNGKLSFCLNDAAQTVVAPCLICLSPYDKVSFFGGDFTARSFAFHPRFLNPALSFEALKKNDFTEVGEEHDRNMMSYFFMRNGAQSGIYPISGNTYFRVAEWLNLIGGELFAQSDVFWSCRTRRYLLQILYLLDDLSHAMPEKEDIELVLEYVQTNYQKDITLDFLCRLFCTNRTTLNRRFKELTGETALQYLTKYRMGIAEEMLSHTNLSIAEIGNACGYRYDSYFVRQFTKEVGMSPTDYRKSARR